MAGAKYTGSGKVATTDFKEVKWVGSTKAGKAVTITVTDAIMMENIDLGMVEKDDTVASLTFTGCYDNTDAASTDSTEPWTVEYADGSTAGAGEIVLGAGLFYIGDTVVALTRGGGKFGVEREFRQINADGDRGPVKDRIELEKSVPKLTMNALTWLTRLTDAYPCIKTVNV